MQTNPILEPKAHAALPAEAGVALAGFDDDSLALCLDAFEHLGRQEGIAIQPLWAVGATRASEGWRKAKQSHPLCQGAREEDSLDGALRDPRVLAVFFSAKEAQTRPQDLLRATSAGKHVFCPSPWAQGLVERAKLEGSLENAARWGLTLVCDHARRADPGYQAIRAKMKEWEDLLGGIDRVDIEFASPRSRSPLEDLGTLAEQADLLSFLAPRFGEEPAWMQRAADTARAWAVDAGAGSLSARLSWRQAEGSPSQERVRVSGPLGSVSAWAEAGVALMTLAGEERPETAQEASQTHADRLMPFEPSDALARARKFRRDFIFSALGRAVDPDRLHTIEDLRRGSFLLCHLIDFPGEVARWKPSAQMAAAPARRDASFGWGVKSRGPLPVAGRRAVAAREAAERAARANSPRAQGAPAATLSEGQETIRAPRESQESDQRAQALAQEGDDGADSRPAWIAGHAEEAPGSLLEKPGSGPERARKMRL